MITVIGMDGRVLAAAAQAAVDAADLVVGGRRHLDSLGVIGDRRVELGPLEPALDRMVAAQADGQRVVVAASGDPGFFGIVRALRSRGLELDVFPATSSIAQAFAAAGLSWEDAVIVSAHGRDLAPAVNVCRTQGKVAVLTGPGSGPAELGVALAGSARTLVIATALGTDQQSLVRCTPAEAAVRDWADPNVVLVLDEAAAAGVAPGPAGWLAGAQSAPAGWALPESQFKHRDSMITKAEVRALVLARLAPRLGQSIWDIGSGSGSVAIECARFGAAVTAIEQDAAASEFIAANARQHGVDVRIVTGVAPAALAGLPAADAIFVGGGGVSVLEAALAQAHPRRAVITLAALDRVAAARAALRADGLEVDGVQLQASRLAPLPGDSIRLEAINPVFVLCGERP